MDILDIQGRYVFLWVYESYTAINHSYAQQSSVVENAINQVSPWSILWSSCELPLEMLRHLNHSID